MTRPMRATLFGGIRPYAYSQGPAKKPDLRPYRRVVETRRVSPDNDAVLWVLECGHSRPPKGAHFDGQARCNACPRSSHA